MTAMQLAMWMNGPSFPMLIPEISMPIIPKDLATKVLVDRFPGKATPLMIALT